MDLRKRPRSAAVVAALALTSGFGGGLSDANAGTFPTHDFAAHESPQQSDILDAASSKSPKSDDGTDPGFSPVTRELAGTSRKVLLSTSDQVNRVISSRLGAIAEGDSSGGWVVANRTRANSEQQGYSSADSHGNTFLAGVDYRKGTVTFGATAGFGDEKTAFPEAMGRFEADRKILGLYGRVEIARSYVAANLTHESLDVEVSGNPSRGAGITTPRADRVQQARIEAGLSGELSPFVALRQANYRRGEFAEDYVALSFSADSQMQRLNYAEIGIRYNKNLDVARGRVWVAGYGLYQRLLSDRSTAFPASTRDPRFPTALPIPDDGIGQDLNKDLGVLGLTVSYNVARDWTGFVEIDAEFASGNFFSQRLGVGLRARF